MYPPASSVPPQYSTTGRYPRTRAESQWESSGLEASPVELKHRRLDQSRPAMHPVRRHALTMDGTRPSIVTRASRTNTPNGRESGEPSNRATAAPLSRAA